MRCEELFKRHLFDDMIQELEKKLSSKLIVDMDELKRFSPIMRILLAKGCLLQWEITASLPSLETAYKSIQKAMTSSQNMGDFDALFLFARVQASVGASDKAVDILTSLILNFMEHNRLSEAILYTASLLHYR